MAFIEDPQGRAEVEKVSRRLRLPVWKSICKGEFRKWWNEWWDKIDTFAETIEGRKIKTGTGLSGGGDLTEDRTLSLKPPTKTEIGGVKQGENITITEDGTINGNPEYVHPSEAGYKHLPVGGAINQILKWASNGTGKWEQIKYSEISGAPQSLKNPYSLKIKLNGQAQTGYDGAQEVSFNITASSIGAAVEGHKHTKNQITDFPTAIKNPQSLTIKVNGTNSVIYNGETTKEVNITAASIGAQPLGEYAEKGHTHTASEVGAYTKNEIDDKLRGKAPASHGNHVPATLAANNKKFLRCDNTWVDVTPANIGAEPTIGTKQNAFNKPFGTAVNTILEGAKLAETLGIPYGGGLNNSNTKTAGYAYYDSTTKKTYKCTVTNTLNYADASKFEAISNADLLAKFQNLVSFVEGGHSTNHGRWRNQSTKIEPFQNGGHSTNHGRWLDIPYPKGFTANNSMVIIQSTGGESSAKFIFKISNDRLKYVAQSINSPDFKPLFIFIKLSQSNAM